jgi:hypothetical protein
MGSALSYHVHPYLEDGRATCLSLLGFVFYEGRSKENRPPFWESFLLRLSRRCRCFDSCAKSALTRIKAQREAALACTQQGRVAVPDDRIYVVVDRMGGQLISLDRMLAELAAGAIDGEDSVLVCDPQLPAVMRSVKGVLVGKNEKMVVMIAMQQFSDKGFMTLKDVVELLCKREIRGDVLVLPADRNAITAISAVGEHTPRSEAVKLKTLLGKGRGTSLMDADGDGRMDLREMASLGSQVLRGNVSLRVGQVPTD